MSSFLLYTGTSWHQNFNIFKVLRRKENYTPSTRHATLWCQKEKSFLEVNSGRRRSCGSSLHSGFYWLPARFDSFEFSNSTTKLLLFSPEHTEVDNKRSDWVAIGSFKMFECWFAASEKEKGNWLKRLGRITFPPLPPKPIKCGKQEVFRT